MMKGRTQISEGEKVIFPASYGMFDSWCNGIL